MGFNPKKPEQIYVDTCFWCRPFDDQTTYRIQEETQALHRLLKFVDTRHIELIRSPFVHFELSFIDDYEKRVQIEKLMMDSGTFVTIPPHTQAFARKIRHECHVNGLDALHIACAINLEIEIFLTCDDELLHKRTCISQFHVEVINPVEYVRRIR